MGLASGRLSFVAAVTLLLPAAATAQFTSGSPVLVSETNLLADCTFALIGGFTPDSEVETWIATNPTDPDNVVSVWQQDRGMTGNARGLVVGVSLDGGQSWQSVAVPGVSRCSGGDFIAATDPWLSFAPNGDLYHSALVFGDGTMTLVRSSIVVSKSVDGGFTWGDPILVFAQDGPFDDKESITADPTDERFVYAVWNRDGRSLFARSTDAGQTWEPAQATDDSVGMLGHQILVLPDGTLIQVMRDLGTLAMKRSADKGANWLPAGDPLPVLPISFAAAVTPTENDVRSGEVLFDIAVDRESGNLYVVWQDGRFGNFVLPKIAFSMSVDGGSHWSEPISIAKTPPNPNALREQSFLPSVHVNDDGVVGVTYYDFRNGSTAEALTDYWFVHCDPARGACSNAANWGPERRLTPTSFDFDTAPTSTERPFLGDYVGLASAGRDFVAAFPQSSSDDPAGVYFVRVEPPGTGPDADGDGVPDAEDNCVEAPNGPAMPDAGGNVQLDSDEDGYGNLCDADLNDDGIVDFLDLGLLKARFFSADPDADLNGDAGVDFLDLGLMKSRFFQPPGPSGLVP